MTMTQNARVLSPSLRAAATSVWDRPRAEAPRSDLPPQTLADMTSTIRFVQPQFAVERARVSAWDSARRPALVPSEATTGMSELPARVAAELSARKPR
jgi:hypothetical protein